MSRHSNSFTARSNLTPVSPGSHQDLGFVFLQMEMRDQAILELEKASALGGGQRIWGNLGYAYAISGQTNKAFKQLESLKKRASRGHVSPFDFAMIYNGLGNKDETVRWLRKAYQEREYGMTFLKVDPIWDNLIPDPRFQELLRQMGL